MLMTASNAALQHHPFASVSGVTTLTSATQGIDVQSAGITQKDTTFTKIFVGGLPYHTTDKTLREHFEAYGEIEEAVVITDRQTGKSRGYGFVTMADRAAAERAIKEPNPSIDGRKANVNLAYLGAKPRGAVAGEEALYGIPITGIRYPLQTQYIPSQFGGLTPSYVYPGSPIVTATPQVLPLVAHPHLTAAAASPYYDLAAAAGYATGYPTAVDPYAASAASMAQAASVAGLYSSMVPGYYATAAFQQAVNAAAPTAAAAGTIPLTAAAPATYNAAAVSSQHSVVQEQRMQ